MKKIVVLGAGKIGSTISKFLYHSGDYDVYLVDNYQNALDLAKTSIDIQIKVLDVSNPEELVPFLKGKDIVVSACSYYLNRIIARCALEAGVSYFDLTEDVETTASIRAIAKEAKEGQVFMPQCGLAPGFIGILGYDIAKQFEKIDNVKMRVGALPQFPSNRMMYNLTWSTDGLINEYCNPCEAIKNGEYTKVLPLEGLEKFSLDGKEYEAFNTSGGLGTLCETLDGKVRDMTYKTVRYTGHRYLMDFLINGLRMGEGKRRETLKEIMESAVPITKQDVVLIFVAVSGYQNGQLVQVSDARKIYHTDMYGEHWSSIQLTTAAGMCAAVDLFVHKKLPQKGFLKQEDIRLRDFLANRFGIYYENNKHHVEI